jgi:hypothetical protein
MIAAGYRVDRTKKFACYGWPTIDLASYPVEANGHRVFLPKEVTRQMWLDH